jgi:hypothetical protein
MTLSTTLDRSRGVDFAFKVRSSFSTPDHPPSGVPGFTLVVSFGRANFCLTDKNVSIALQSCFGCDPSLIHTSCIRERVFSFNVISKAVGFMIYNLSSFSCPAFKCYFHLWGFGGPQWIREHRAWLKEIESEWHYVPSRSSSSRLLTGANSIPIQNPRSFADVVRHDPMCSSTPDPTSSGSPRYSRPLQFSNQDYFRVSLSPPSRPLAQPTNTSNPPAHHDASVSCTRCLAPGHLAHGCTSHIRCNCCYRYGHIRKSCYVARNKQLIFRIKRPAPSSTAQPSPLISPAVSPPLNPVACHPSPDKTPQTPNDEG